MSDWTRDEGGEFIDWTQPPYYVSGILNLVLPGERNVHPDILSKRRVEYVKLQKRRLKKKAPGIAPRGPKQNPLF